jgi:hypothetical protein
MRAEGPQLVTPEKLPDPWLLDTECLLRELARIREHALHIPITMDAVGPINVVVNAVWELETRMRYLLMLKTEGQIAFRTRYQTKQKKSKKAVAEGQNSKIVSLSGGNSKRVHAG